MSETAFKLSEPGTNLSQDPATWEYLRCYDFPQPPEVRYGFRRFNSPQKNDRVSLFGQAWLPPHARGTVLLLHGYSEHGGNYATLVKDFVANKLAVAVMDLRGHGLSEGPRGHLESPYSYAEDVEEFLSGIFPYVLPNSPLYLWGHSLGATVGLQLIHRGNLPARPSAAVFSSALLGLPELSGHQKLLAGCAPFAASLFPTLPVNHGIPPEVLSHDREYLERRSFDPLISRISTPRWLLSVRKALGELQGIAPSFQAATPTLFLLAGDERVTSLNAARQFAFHAYANLRHKVIEFPGYFHELEKEPEIRPRVVSESLAWFKSHK